MKTLIKIPNIPFAFIFSLFLVYMVYRQTSAVEIELTEPKLPDELKARMKRLYPEHLKVFIAVVSYSSLAIYLLK